MARKTSDFVKAFGTAFEIWKALVEAVFARGGTDDDLRRILREKSLREELAKLIVRVRNTFRAVVDYANAFHLEVANGTYDYANPNITHLNFPTDKRGTEEVDLELLHFDRGMTSEEVLRECDRLGYRAANARETLAFGRTHKEEQRKYPIVALGSSCVVYGYRHVLVLYSDSTYRYLNLYWFDDGWYSFYRFLVVRK